MICQYHSESELGQLIYPLVQVLTGFLQMNKSVEYIPFHLHLIDLLIKIQEKTGRFVPVLNHLLYYLSSAEFSKKKQISAKRPFDLVLHLKISKSYMNTNVLWNGIFDKLLNQIVAALSVNSRDIGFPESSYALIKQLKQLNKSYKYNGYKIKIKELIKLLEKNNDIVFARRQNTQIAPRNTKKVQEFSGNPLPRSTHSPRSPVPTLCFLQAPSGHRPRRHKYQSLTERDQVCT